MPDQPDSGGWRRTGGLHHQERISMTDNDTWTILGADSPASAEESAPLHTRTLHGGDHDGAAVAVDRQRKRWRQSEAVWCSAVMVIALVAVSVLAGGWGWRAHRLDMTRHDRAAALEAGRQAAVDLTTIAYSSVDEDIQRVLDSSEAPFHEEFERNSAAFAEAVRRAQSTSRGSVTAAGIESQDGDTTQVIVTMKVQTTTTAGPQENPREWRLRITLRGGQGGQKVADVGFVP
jgi:Mce-associated membrane protein